MLAAQPRRLSFPPMLLNLPLGSRTAFSRACSICSAVGLGYLVFSSEYILAKARKSDARLKYRNPFSTSQLIAGVAAEAGTPVKSRLTSPQKIARPEFM